MKNKGFTLMELLGSITILALIAVIAFPALLNLLGDSQSKTDKAKHDYVITAARDYVSDNNPSDGNIYVQTLIDENYIDDTDSIKDMKEDCVEYTKGNPSTYEYKKEKDC